VHAYIPSKSEPLDASGAAGGRDEGSPVANHTSRCPELASLCHWAEHLDDIFAAVDGCECEAEDTVMIASETCRRRGSTFRAQAKIRRSGCHGLQDLEFDEEVLCRDGRVDRDDNRYAVLPLLQRKLSESAS
jgi:hypothetical protein